MSKSKRKTPAVPFKLYCIDEDMDGNPTVESVTVDRVSDKRWTFQRGESSGLAFRCRSYCEPFPDYYYYTTGTAWRSAISSARESIHAQQLKYRKLMRAYSSAVKSGE